MKNLLLLFLFFVISFLSAGCPYTSKVPIDEPNVKVDNNYFGIWEDKSSGTEYNVNKMNDYEYLITQIKDTTNEETEKLSDGTLDPEYEETSKPTVYTGHISKINDYYFLNLKENSNDFLQSNEYNIYKIDFTTSSEFRLTEITSLIKEKFENSVDLKNYIEKYMDKDISFFYGAEYIYRLQK